MTLETQFESAKKIITDVVNENKDIWDDKEFELELLKLSRELLSILSIIIQTQITAKMNNLPKKAFSNVNYAAGSLDVAISKLDKEIKK